MMKQANAGKFRFGAFELDAKSGRLLKDGVAQKLQPQPFRLLLLLVTRRGELVSRDELREELWPDGTSVEFDQGLNFCIRQIRAALGDQAREPKFIETLPKRGYRFIALDPEPSALLAAAPQLARSSWPPIAVGIAAALLIGFSFWLVGIRGRAKSVLVRPFVSIGMSADDAWVGDAMTQQIIASLTGAKQFRVIPWSTSRGLKGVRENLHELGKRYQADLILEGSVQRLKGRLHVSAQLVDASQERTIWSHQDERDASELGTLQDGILKSIAGTLRMRLVDESVPAARRRPADVDTYNLYLKAVSMADQFSRDGVRNAIEKFEEVIRREPGYAPAYAGLANALVIQPYVSETGSRGTERRAKEIAERAIAMDPSLALAHAALAHLYFNEWDAKAAETEFQAALSLDPDVAMTSQLYGIFLASRDRPGEALLQARRAVELAPTSGLISFSLAKVLFHCGRFDESIAQCRRTLEIDRAFHQAKLIVARAYAMKGMSGEAMAALDDWERSERDRSQPLWRAYIVAQGGGRQEALRRIQEWRATDPRSANPPMALAVALFSAGEKDLALDALRRSVERRMPSAVWLRNTPELAGLRADTRFAALVASMDRRATRF